MYVFAIGTIGLTAALAYMTAMTARILRRGPLPYNPLLHPAESLFRIALIVVCGLLMWRSGLPAEQFGFVSVEIRRDLLLGIFVGVAIVWAVNVISFLVVSETTAGFYSKNALFSMRPHSFQQMLLTVPAALPAAALEELLFRGMLIGGFSMWFPASLLVLATAVLFGILHVAQGVWGMALTGLIGLVFGILYVWSGSIWFVLVMHWVMNLNQFVVAYRWPSVFRLDELASPPAFEIEST